MTLSLDGLGACFEGVIPSIIATVSGEGVPNISYLSHVVQVDASHVALSNQFFGKTVANLRAVPRASILVVDGLSGAQYRLEALLIRSETSGALFERMATQVRVSSAQTGMAGVMRLKAADVFRVIKIVPIPWDQDIEASPELLPVDQLRAASRIGTAVSEASELGQIVDAVLDGMMRELRCHAASVLLCEASRPVLTTIGTRGYGRTGIGSEIAFDDGVIGAAATERRIVKISDLSRVQRLGAAVQASANDETENRSISVPGLDGAMSRIAMPIEFQKRLIGVLLLESRTRLAFGREAEVLIEVVARLAGAAIAFCETAGAAESALTRVAAPPPPAAQSFKVVHHAYDDSVFIEDSYVIKGVAGRLLMLILELHLKEGRVEFSNRELRLNEATRLPDFKDNLETRLLLLRRRLEEKQAPLRLIHAGRGQLRLDLRGLPVLQHV